MKKVLRNVAKLLRENEDFRNDDLPLIFAYWNLVDKVNIKKPNVPITSPETICRVRRRLQAEGYFLPTDPKVLKKRRKQEIKIRIWLQDMDVLLSKQTH